LKEKLQTIPDEDPGGCSVVFPPIRTLDFVEWHSNDDENDPAFLFIPRSVEEEPPRFLPDFRTPLRRGFSDLSQISPCSVNPKGDLPRRDNSVPVPVPVPVPEVVTHGVVPESSLDAPEDRPDCSNDSVSRVPEESFMSDQE
jgi:hypothetical protein